jgi:hypothetical protein
MGGGMHEHQARGAGILQGIMVSELYPAEGGDVRKPVPALGELRPGPPHHPRTVEPCAG